MKSWFRDMLLLLGCTAAVAEPVQQGVLPMKDIREFGAIGDGRVDDTSAIQAALQGGGLIVVPAGRYLTGTLYLESDTELRLAPGAELLASTDPAAYNPAQFSPENTLPSVTERVSARHLLIAIGKKNITLSGGRINGNAPGWMPERPVRRGEDFFANLNPERSAQMLYFRRCEEIEIRDVTLVDATYWHLFLHQCRNIRLEGIRIFGRHYFLNGDGIDVDACSNVMVRNCIIDTSDDAITLRASDRRSDLPPPVCENVIVSNCVLRSSFANAIRIGVGNGTIRNSLIDNIIVRESATALSIISRYNANSAGCLIENITFSNLLVGAGRFLSLKTILNEQVPPPERPGAAIRNLLFVNISGSTERTSWIFGTPANPVENLRFSEITITHSGSGTSPDIDANGFWGRGSSDAVLELHYTRDIHFNRVRLLRSRLSDLEKYDAVLHCCRNTEFENCLKNDGIPWRISTKTIPAQNQPHTAEK